ncbi:MAG: EAL domain-containing protein, partial [Dehalococcoidia bacterium]|nr:EAL domain-containing protein [Dehalococcoidia bacterium]
VHQAGLRVIAEGVESMEQAEVLLGIHCDEGQGVYLGYPMADTSLHAAQLAEVNLPPGAAAAAG